MSNIQVKEEGIGNNLINHSDASIDLFFKMHQKINSKNEEISQSYSNNIIIKFIDIEELHHKTIQSIKSLKPIKSNINVRIAVSHNEGASEKLNSFESFEKYNKTSPNPTSDIVLIYTFSIYDEEINNFENYKVFIQLRSRLAELKNIEQEAPTFISSALISSLVTITAKIKIEYSDYVKARHFTAMFDEWIRGCDETKSKNITNNLKKISHLFAPFGKITLYSLMAIFTIKEINTNTINQVDVLKFLIAYASFFLIISGITEMCLRKLEKSIDSHLDLSYIDINKGDAKLIKDFSNRNKKTLILSILGFLGAISMSVISRLSYDAIKFLIH